MNKKMKKLGLYIMALLSTGLMSCNQDFETIFSPLSNEPESLLQVSDVSVASTMPAAINLAEYFDLEAGTTKAIPIGTVTVKEGAMPANTILKAEVEFSKDADFANSIALDANSLEDTNEISVNPSILQDAYFNEITRNPATVEVFVRTVLYTVTGGTAEAIVGKPGENFFAERSVQFTPLNKVQISPAYYVIGAAGGWSADGARTQKFNHSDADVYEDPIFTIIVDTGGDDCWFAIGDDTAIDAVAAGDWTQLFGTKGASEDLTGTMDRRYNLGGDHSFHITGAKKLRITLDMLEYSYTIEPINVADSYYLVGGPEDWAGSAASKSQKFSHSSASIADDPTFTYLLKGSDGDIWFAIGDDEACDAIANNGDWSKLYGTTAGNGNSGMSGSLARRSSLSDEGSFKIDGTAADFFRITINMAELTYEITPINIAAQYYVVGGVQGWSDSKKTCLFTPEEKKNVLSYTTKWTGAWDLKIWDAEHFGNWDAAWGCAVDGDNSPSGALLNSGAQAISAPSAEFYTFTIDMNTQTYTWTKLDNQTPTEYENISLIGEFNGWSGDFELEQVTPHNWYGVFTQESDGQLKYRANHDWSVNWGYGNDKDWNVADSFNKIGTNGGGNIWVPAGTYAVYLNDITNSMLIIAQ